jgi:DNA-binding response OmpR family regulator
LIKQISSSGMFGHIPLVVLSGLDRPQTESKCRELGVAGYFMKPFNPVDMLETVNALMKEGITAAAVAS